MIRVLITAAAVVALSSCAATSAPQQAGAAPDPATAHPVPTKLTGYLPKDALDGKSILPPPPGVDSPTARPTAPTMTRPAPSRTARAGSWRSRTTTCGRAGR